MRILLVEDEKPLSAAIVKMLEQEHFALDAAYTGPDGLDCVLSGIYDAIVLDVMLPGMDGFAVCRALREKSDTMGIIMLTARTQEMEKVGGLMMGADDYVTKPFSPSELVARVDALYRRVSALRDRATPNLIEEMQSGEFTLNLRTRTLKKRGEPLELTQVEFQILEYFFTNEGKALSRSDILTHVWGTEYFGEEKIVDVNIRRLRMKVEDDPSNPRHILTVWGMGYKWQSA